MKIFIEKALGSYIGDGKVTIQNDRSQMITLKIKLVKKTNNNVEFMVGFVNDLVTNLFPNIKMIRQLEEI